RIVRMTGILHDCGVVLHGARPEFSKQPGARLAHNGLSAQVVELEDDSGVGRGGERLFHWYFLRFNYYKRSEAKNTAQRWPRARAKSGFQHAGLFDSGKFRCWAKTRIT